MYFIGNSNTGNVSYRLLSNSKILAEVCDVPEELIKNLLNIWIALSCGQPIIAKKFDDLCKTTWILFKEKISWHPGI